MFLKKLPIVKLKVGELITIFFSNGSMVHVHNKLRQGCDSNKYWSLCDFIKTYINIYGHVYFQMMLSLSEQRVFDNEIIDLMAC